MFISDAQREARRLGGIATAKKYGHDQLSAWAKSGSSRAGRPKNLTLEEIQAREALNN
jgi:hypothetical protein